MTLPHAIIGALLLAAMPAPAQAAPPTLGDTETRDPRYGLLTPLPDHGAVPPIVALLDAPTPRELELRARARGYERQIRRIRREHLGSMRKPEIRAEGIEKLREFRDPAALPLLIEQTRREADDVRLALLDHFTELGDPGQAALAWIAITDEDDAIRHEATTHMVAPASPAVLAVLDRTLRSSRHAIVNRAGALAGALGAIETVPLLMFAQASADPVPAEGDLAWIAIETQVPFVAGLQAVVGDNAAAYQPIIGLVTEGVVLRVVDAVAISYRTEVHVALVNLTSEDWGRPTDYLGYDMQAWWRWYNDEYVPFRNERARQAALEEPTATDP